MQKLLYILTLLLLISLCACNESKNVSPIFNHAEAIMDMYPDSALLLLDSVRSPENLSKKEYAIWCLLLTQARDKNYVKHTSDSLITVSVKYFEQTDDRIRYATSLYYKGRVCQDLKKNEEATVSYLKAFDIAKNTSDYNLLFLISSHSGTLYAYRDMKDEALSAYRKAYEYAVLAKDSSSMAYANAYIGRIYGVSNQWEQAVSSYQAAVQIAEQVNDSSALKLALKELASIYICVRQFKKASDCLQQIENISKDKSFKDMAMAYLTWGNLYRLMGQYGIAIGYLNKALQTDNMYTKREACQYYYYLYEKQAQYDKAIYYNNKYWLYNDSIQSLDNRKVVQEINAKYENEKLLNINNQLRWKRKQEVFVAFLIILFFCVCFIGVFIHYRRVLLLKNKKIQNANKEAATYLLQMEQGVQIFRENEKKIRDLSLLIKGSREEQLLLALEKEKLQIQNDEIKQLNEKLHEKIQKLYFTLQLKKEDVLKYQKTLEDRESCSNILVRLKRKLFYLTDDDWEELVVMVDVIFNQFSERLMEKHPGLTKDDLRYCCLIKLGYSISEISVMMAIQPTTVSTRKQRIKKHLDISTVQNTENMENYIKNF